MTRIGILYPNVKDINEYFRIVDELLNASHHLLQCLDDSLPEDMYSENMAQINGSLIYSKFGTYVSKFDRELYMTWDELRSESQNIPALDVDNAIKHLLTKGLLKEGSIEIP